MQKRPPESPSGTANAVLADPRQFPGLQDMLHLLCWTGDARGALVRARRGQRLETVLSAGPWAARYRVGELVPIEANPYCRAVLARAGSVYLRDTRATRTWRHGFDYQRSVCAYAGYPLLSAEGVVIGTVALLFREPINKPAFHRELLRRFVRFLQQLSPNERAILGEARDLAAALPLAPPASAAKSESNGIVVASPAPEQVERDYARLATVVEQATDGILLVGPAGHVEYVNPALAKLTGLQNGMSVGRLLATLLAGDADRALLENMLDTLRSGGVWKGQLGARLRRRRIDAEVNVSVVQGKGGTVAGYAAIVRDITQELELEKRLRQAEKMEAVGQLAGGVSHDFNNVLTAIFGSVGLMRGQLGGENVDRETIRRGLEQIQGAARHAATLTRQLLAFARQQVLRLEPVAVNRVIQDAERLLRRLLTENITLKLELADDVRAVQADVGQLEQLIINLCVNARDAMAAGGGTVVITTENVLLDESYARSHHDAGTGPHVALRVSDTGEGITKENLEHIFEPFFTTKPSGKGTGLGLSTVYAIVRRLGGHIAVESSVGEGTVFAIYLPALAESVEPPAPVDIHDYFPTGTEAILICEDDDAIREIECEMLDRCGHDVHTAASAEEVLALTDDELKAVDLFITDVVLPGISGGQLAQAVRARVPEARFVFVSGHSHDTLLVQSPEVLKDPVLYKPFTSREFLQHVRAMLDGEFPASDPDA